MVQSSEVVAPASLAARSSAASAGESPSFASSSAFSIFIAADTTVLYWIRS